MEQSTGFQVTGGHFTGNTTTMGLWECVLETLLPGDYYMEHGEVSWVAAVCQVRRQVLLTWLPRSPATSPYFIKTRKYKPRETTDLTKFTQKQQGLGQEGSPGFAFFCPQGRAFTLASSWFPKSLTLLTPHGPWVYPKNNSSTVLLEMPKNRNCNTHRGPGCVQTL